MQRETPAYTAWDGPQRGIPEGEPAATLTSSAFGAWSGGPCAACAGVAPTVRRPAKTGGGRFQPSQPATSALPPASLCQPAYLCGVSLSACQALFYHPHQHSPPACPRPSSFFNFIYDSNKVSKLFCWRCAVLGVVRDDAQTWAGEPGLLLLWLARAGGPGGFSACLRCRRGVARCVDTCSTCRWGSLSIRDARRPSSVVFRGRFRAPLPRAR